MKIVIALGGNALGQKVDEQIVNCKLTAKYLLPIIKDGHQVIITHGNGPQVGLINLAFDEGKKQNNKVYDMGFSECGAMSQGYIAYHLINALRNQAIKDNVNVNFSSVITHVLVDKNDEAFNNPTKPIGSFYTKEEAEKLPYITKEDSGRGYRRVIASPKPLKIIEEKDILNLINLNSIVICCGGGGIPVIKENGSYQGIDAVIDKDFASSKLASDIDADMLLILTAIENAKINFGKENEKSLHFISKNEIIKYLNNNEFKAGSMKPKVEACINFVKDNKVAIITNIENAYLATKKEKGTIITN